MKYKYSAIFIYSGATYFNWNIKHKTFHIYS